MINQFKGDFSFKNNRNLNYYEQAVIAYPEIKKIKLTKEIDFVILGCDGFFDCVDYQKVCELISMELKKNKLNKSFKLSDLLADLFDKIISKSPDSKFVFNKM